MVLLLCPSAPCVIYVRIQNWSIAEYWVRIPFFSHTAMPMGVLLTSCVAVGHMTCVANQVDLVQNWCTPVTAVKKKNQTNKDLITIFNSTHVDKWMITLRRKVGMRSWLWNIYLYTLYCISLALWLEHDQWSWSVESAVSSLRSVSYPLQSSSVHSSLSWPGGDD